MGFLIYTDESGLGLVLEMMMVTKVWLLQKVTQIARLVQIWIAWSLSQKNKISRYLCLCHAFEIFGKLRD